MADVNIYKCAGLVLAVLLALALLYVVVWVASRAFHDARYSAVTRYGRRLHRRQRDGAKQ